MKLNLFLARSEQDLRDIYSLRYRAYRAIDAIASNDTGRFSDDFDRSDKSWCFGIRAGDRTIGSLRALSSNCGGRDLAAYRAYPEAIEESFLPTHRVVEANRFVMEPALEVPLGAMDRQLLLFRAFIVVALNCQADYYIGAARRNHVAFYRRVALMAPISEERQYPGLQAHMALLGGNFAQNYRRVCDLSGDRLRIPHEEVHRWHREMLPQ